MPEMPEVESIVSGIRTHIEGHKIKAVEVFEGRENVIKYPNPMQFVHGLTGRTIITLKRRGKYIIMELDNNTKLIIHLRMTGKLVFTPYGQPVDNYSCILMILEDGNKLVYADIRRLGTLDLVKPEELPKIKGLYTLGAEPLSAEFTPEYLREHTRRNHSKLKPFLLNQKNIAGLGNIYVDEALAISKLHPETIVSGLSTRQLKALHTAINKVISEGIKDGGTSFRDYRNGLGKKGSHQENLYVYNRQDLPCKFCGTPIAKMTLNGRGTHYCPHCQKLKIRDSRG